MEEIFRLFLVYNCFLFVFLLHQWFVSSSFFLFFSFFFYIMDSAELPEWMSQEHMTGTTIMAVEYKGGVVIGADSRTTTGAYIANRVTDKLTYINDRIYCCRSGSAADTQAIASYVQYYLNMHAIDLGSRPRVKTAASLFGQLCYGNRDSLSAGIICAGWDEHEGGQVFSIPLGGMVLRQPFSIGGECILLLWR
eukprot:Sdes_comp19185_c0_seq7m10010